MATAQIFTPENAFYLALVILGFFFIFLILRQPYKLRYALPVILVSLIIGNPMLLAVAAAPKAASSTPSLMDVLVGDQDEVQEQAEANAFDALTSPLAANDSLVANDPRCGVSDDRSTDIFGVDVDALCRIFIGFKTEFADGHPATAGKGGLPRSNHSYFFVQKIPPKILLWIQYLYDRFAL